jgi:hypothetical protein
LQPVYRPLAAYVGRKPGNHKTVELRVSSRSRDDADCGYPAMGNDRAG